MSGAHTKLLVLSDTHGILENAMAVLDGLQYQIDAVIHLGDHDSDAARLQRAYPTIPFYVVRGNNDLPGDAPHTLLVTLGGRRLFLAHGNRHRVYSGYQTISYAGEAQGADAVLFGHTHRPLCLPGKPLLLNPGSISLPRGGAPTYALLEWTGEEEMYAVIMEYTPG